MSNEKQLSQYNLTSLTLTLTYFPEDWSQIMSGERKLYLLQKMRSYRQNKKKKNSSNISCWVNVWSKISFLKVVPTLSESIEKFTTSNLI